MNLNAEQVEHVARLARLELVEEEKERLGQQLSSILEYVGQLQGIDTSAVEPMNHVADLVSVWGEDEAAPSTEEERSQLLAAFPEREGDLLKVKSVFS